MRSEVHRIVRIVEESYGLPRGSVYTDGQHRRFAAARHVSIWCARQLTDLTLQDLGTIFDRHHATIHYAINAIRDRADHDPLLAEGIQAVSEAYSRDLQPR